METNNTSGKNIRLINATTCEHMWGNVDKMEVKIVKSPICFSDVYYYYIDAKLLIRKVNDIVVGYLTGDNAKIAYNEIGGEISSPFKYLVSLMANISGFNSDQIVSKSQKAEIVCCRQLITWHYKKLKDASIVDMTLQEIGDLFGQNHATVLHSYESMERDYKFMKPFEKKYKMNFINHMKLIYDIY